VNCSVASVTVTYNSARVLPRLMDALRRQTRPLDEIIVVDSVSSDGTRELLAELYPEVKVISIPENIGAAGAVGTGMEYAALERKHDWVLTFDDDSVPQDDALEALLKGIRTKAADDERIGMAASLPVQLKTGTCYEPLFWRDGFVRPPADLLREPVFFPDLVISSGCMVRREVVERVGVPRADFFMDFMDFEYCLRVRARGYRIAVVTASKLAHEIGNAREIRLLGWVRQTAEHAPWREYYGSRNLVYIAWHLYPSRKTKLFALRFVMRHAVGVMLFSREKFACLTRMAQGFSDGWRGRLGARFLPGF
jgi:GT2 family glycosyltransferase